MVIDSFKWRGHGRLFIVSRIALATLHTSVFTCISKHVHMKHSYFPFSQNSIYTLFPRGRHIYNASPWNNAMGACILVNKGGFLRYDWLGYS